MNDQYLDGIDLRRQSVSLHFSALLGSEASLNYLAGMDAVDSWAFDHEHVEHAHAADAAQTLARLGSAIQQSIGVLDHAPEELVRVLARITTSRSVYVTGYITRRNPQALAALQLAGEDFENDSVLLEKLVMQRRLVALERAGVLARVFSRERLGEIERIMNLPVDEGERDGS